jgi:hypothetical protein
VLLLPAVLLLQTSLHAALLLLLLHLHLCNSQS